jgi:8-oxo-dGTP pyrophosphatase MutT (NUDIX family)
VPVKPPPATPAPAATLVLLRDGAAGSCEALLIERHHGSRFAAGAFVFPGGRIETGDAPDDAARWCVGLEPAAAAEQLGAGVKPAEAVGYWIGAIRETFEEVGVLLARGLDGGPMTVAAERLREHRRACQRDAGGFWAMLREERLSLATDRLVYFAHWITPEEQPLRFDTRFFAAPWPAGQEAVADDREIVTVRWVTPAAALAARARGELAIRLPTAKTLGLLEGADSVAVALERLRQLPVSPVRPRLVTEDGRVRAILPGEPGYY